MWTLNSWPRTEAGTAAALAAAGLNIWRYCVPGTGAGAQPPIKGIRQRYT